MAKRGYRGKHPHNDMKVEIASSTKYSPKLKTQYDKLKNDKTKYDFIRTNYFNPQSTCTITFDAQDCVTNENIVITSTDGTSVTYTAQNSEDASSNEFKKNVDNSGSLITCINNAAGHGGKIVATLSSHNNVLLTQVQPGPDGNTKVSGSIPMSASGQSGAKSINGSFSF
jgi:hypothetical protein